jgi:hypothetical protein
MTNFAKIFSKNSQILEIKKFEKKEKKDHVLIKSFKKID